MSIGGPGHRPSKNERREAAREKAKVQREAQRKKDRRNRVLLQGGLVVVVLAIVAGVAVIIATAIRPASPGPANMASDGIVFGQDMKVVPSDALAAGAEPQATKTDPSVPNIRIYLDYLCPFCGQFEETNAEQLTSWAESGTVTVEYHPIAFLTSKSAGTQYSLRSANAAACVANYSPNDWPALNNALFANQPEEGTAGLTNDQIKKLVADTGTSEAKKINSCIDDFTYKSWVQNATDRALGEPIPNSSLEKLQATPTILVNDKQYTGSITDAKEFQAFVLSTASETYSTSSPTPTSGETATPSETPAPSETPEATPAP